MDRETRRSSVGRTSRSPPGLYADVLQTPQGHYLDDPKPQLLYPPTAEITPAARRKAEEERAVLEAMTQSASLPVSPYLGPTGFLNFVNTYQTAREPGDESFQFGTYVPLGFGMQGQMNNGGGIGMNEEFPSLDEIISSMEGSGMEGGFGFLDDLNLFEGTM
jgi:hypothetical protein